MRPICTSTAALAVIADSLAKSQLMDHVGAAPAGPEDELDFTNYLAHHQLPTLGLTHDDTTRIDNEGHCFEAHCQWRVLINRGLEESAGAQGAAAETVVLIVAGAKVHGASDAVGRETLPDLSLLVHSSATGLQRVL